jgi:putative DNA primase/helicase
MDNTLLALDVLLSKFEGVRQTGDNYQAKCPAHDDSTASLSIRQASSGAFLFKCFAGCSFKAIIDAIGLTAGHVTAPKHVTPLPRQIASYDYRDLTGRVIYRAVRYEPKDFKQCQPNGAGGWIWNMRGVQRVPYRLNELKGHQTIYIAEGEKDVDNLWARGLPATTNIGGAGKWKDEDTIQLRDLGIRKCVLLPDNDAPGKKHMAAVAQSLKRADIAIVTIELLGLAAKEDVSDWFARGKTAADLEAIVKSTPFIVPKNPSTIPSTEPDPEHDPRRWNQTDLGAAEAFAHRHGDDIRFDYQQERWLLWDQHYWRSDADSAIYRLAHRHVRQWQIDCATLVPDKDERKQWNEYLMRLEKRSGLENFIAISKTLKPVADDGERWDFNPMIFAVPNGVIDLRSGDLRPGRRDDRLTFQSSTLYDADKTCPRWEQFLQEIFDGNNEIIGYIQRALGYSLTGDMSEQCFFMCVGHGSNGKSTFLATLEAVWGKYSYTTDIKTFTTNNQSADQGFDLAELAHRRLILASETKANSHLNEQALKNFTGGEKINAQRKYGHPFEYSPTGKIWIGVNHQPRVKDDSFGFWRRVRIVPFERTFAGSAVNARLRDELIAEAPGILNWAIVGCLAWQRDGLVPPASVFTATDAYRDAEDPLAEFLAEATEADSDAQTPAIGLFRAYTQWAQDQGLTERERLTKTSFGRLLSRRYDKKHTMYGWRYLGVRTKLRPKDLLSTAE